MWNNIIPKRKITCKFQSALAAEDANVNPHVHIGAFTPAQEFTAHVWTPELSLPVFRILGLQKNVVQVVFFRR